MKTSWTWRTKSHKDIHFEVYHFILVNGSEHGIKSWYSTGIIISEWFIGSKLSISDVNIGHIGNTGPFIGQYHRVNIVLYTLNSYIVLPIPESTDIWHHVSEGILFLCVGFWRVKWKNYFFKIIIWHLVNVRNQNDYEHSSFGISGSFILI